MLLPKSRALPLIFVLVILLFSNCSESQNGLESSVSEDKAAEEIFNSGEKEILRKRYGDAVEKFKEVASIVNCYLMADIAHPSGLIAAGIHIMSKMGAFNGLVIWLSKYAKSKRSALLITYFMGFVVFFDDYANTLVVGSTMQKITDKFKISREKLAFIVDATAAPIASIAIVSTWIGYEVQLIGEAINDYNYPGMENGFIVFLNSIGYSFYPLLILVFILILIISKKDFGPMFKFEKAAVFQKEGVITYVAHNAGEEDVTVLFNDDTSINVPAGETVTRQRLGNSDQLVNPIDVDQLQDQPAREPGLPSTPSLSLVSTTT